MCTRGLRLGKEQLGGVDGGGCAVYTGTGPSSGTAVWGEWVALSVCVLMSPTLGSEDHQAPGPPALCCPPTREGGSQALTQGTQWRGGGGRWYGWPAGRGLPEKAASGRRLSGGLSPAWGQYLQPEEAAAAGAGRRAAPGMSEGPGAF